MAELLAGEKIVLSDGSKVQAEEYLKDKVIALYFSAGWCPPCRAFTPKLKKFYEEIKKAGKNFEVVFVSRDHSASDLVEYYRDYHGAWVYLEFGNPKIQKLLVDFEVKTIPTCKVIKSDGTVVVDDATVEVQGSEDALGLWEEWTSSVFGSCVDFSGDELFTAEQVGSALGLSPSVVNWIKALPVSDFDPILVLDFSHEFLSDPWPNDLTGDMKKAFVIDALVGQGGKRVEDSNNLVHFLTFNALYRAQEQLRISLPWLFYHPNLSAATKEEYNINQRYTIGTQAITFFSDDSKRFSIHTIPFFLW